RVFLIHANWFAAGKRNQFCDPNILLRKARVEIFENFGPKKPIVDGGGKRRTNGVERSGLFAQLLDLCFRGLHRRIDVSDLLGAGSRPVRGSVVKKSPAKKRQNNSGGRHYKNRPAFFEFLPTNNARGT